MAPNADYYPCVTPEGGPDCPYQAKGCLESQHHLYWPGADYATVTEKVFRNLPENIVTMCRLLHDEVHQAETPPEKPDVEHMIDRIATSGLVLSLYKQRRIYGNNLPPAA